MVPARLLRNALTYARAFPVEVVITAEGPQVITRFPSQELFVANEY